MFEDFSSECHRVARVHAVFAWLDTLHSFLTCYLGGAHVGAVARNAKGVPRESRGRSWSFDVRRDDATTLTFYVQYRPGSADGYPTCGVLINGEDSGYQPEPSINPLENDKSNVMDYFDLLSVQYAA